MLLLAATLAIAAPTPDWMGTLYASRPDTRLTQVVIPGTHDSGAFAIDTKKPCKVTPIAGLNSIQVGAAKANPCAAGRLAKAQSSNFTGQLNGGVRYLDMRLGVPAPKLIKPAKIPKKLSNAAAAKVPIVLQHSYASIRFTKALQQIVGFARTHPREQIILDFQHIDLTGKKKVDSYYTSAIDKVLRSYKVADTTTCGRAWSATAIPDPLTATLGQAWAADRNILVLYAKGELPKRDCFRPRESVLYSPWPNTEDPATSDAANLTSLTSRQAALNGQTACSLPEGNQCGLFVDQLQLSFTFASQAQCLSGTRTQNCSLEDLARLRNPGIVPQMQSWQAQGLPINVSIVDFFEISDTARGLIALNQ
jgi:hypothetical protein